MDDMIFHVKLDPAASVHVNTARLGLMSNRA